VTFKPDIIRTIRNEGFELKQRGKSFWAKCPFHQEKSPSFSVNPGKQVFYCFGCQRGGDAITFIQELKGLSFKEACNYFHLEKSRPVVSPEVLEKKRAIEGFKWWCKDRENGLCLELQTLNRLVLSIETNEDLKKCAPIFSVIADINYYLDILQGDDEEDKFNFYLEEKGSV
jgi:hypothetical protein